MKPLQAIALGVVLLALGPADPKPGVFDPLPDPLGWFLILVGLHGLREVLEPARLPVLRFLGVVALGFSVALVVPAAARWLATDPSLGWTADVPRFAFFVLLCHLLSRSALAARQTAAASMFSLAGLALVFVLLAPPLEFGAGWTGFGPAGEFAAQVTQLALVILCFVYGGRTWAGAPPEPVSEESPEPPRT